MKTKFIIVTGPYETKRNGNVVLHRLYETVLSLGYEVHLLFNNAPGAHGKLIHSTNPALYNPDSLGTHGIYKSTSNDLEQIIRSGVVVYPEIITGNPLRATNVCRYLLNKEAALQGRPMQASKRDFILAFSKLFLREGDPPFTLFCPPNLNWVERLPWLDTEKRPFDSFYVGKGSRYHSGIEPPPDFVEITREWPKSQTEFQRILGGTRIFLSYDILSASNSDALLAGALPVIAPGNAPFCLEEIMESELGFFALPATFIPQMLAEGIPKEVSDKVKSTRQSILRNAQVYEAGYVRQVKRLIERLENHFSL